MKHKTLALSAFLVCLFGAAIAWSYFDSLRPDAYPLEANDALPGRVFAYSLSFPFDDLNAVALEVRRVSSNRDKRYNVGSVNGNLCISREDADMVISTSLISSSEIRNGVLVSTCLFEIEDLLDKTSTPDEWTIAGQLKILGVSSKLSPKANFLRGGSLSTGWERNPRWNGNEICVGRFRTHDENQIYDYNCVVVACNSDK